MTCPRFHDLTTVEAPDGSPLWYCDICEEHYQLHRDDFGNLIACDADGRQVCRGCGEALQDRQCAACR